MDIIDMINLDHRDCIERWDQLARTKATIPRETWNEHFDSLLRTICRELSAQKSVIWERYLAHPALSEQAHELVNRYELLTQKAHGFSVEKASHDEFEELRELANGIIDRDTLFLEDMARWVPRLFRGKLVNEYESSCEYD